MLLLLVRSRTLLTAITIQFNPCRMIQNDWVTPCLGLSTVFNHLKNIIGTSLLRQLTIVKPHCNTFTSKYYYFGSKPLVLSQSVKETVQSLTVSCWSHVSFTVLLHGYLSNFFFDSLKAGHLTVAVLWRAWLRICSQNVLVLEKR